MARRIFPRGDEKRRRAWLYAEAILIGCVLASGYAAMLWEAGKRLGALVGLI